ncbi:hypothetical protein, partial [Pseudomonas amygdali]|uniref:hypothetical protein n=1 Tax=Pseudomonas amygdali TaxID=47877 RepID=UPI001F2558A6
RVQEHQQVGIALASPPDTSAFSNLSMYRHAVGYARKHLAGDSQWKYQKDAWATLVVPKIPMHSR